MKGRDDLQGAESGADGRDPERGLEERLLHGLLARTGEAAPRSDDEARPDDDEWAALCEGSEARRQLHELEGFLATCKAALVPERAAGADERLVRRILERTTAAAGSALTREAVPTREFADPSWRGDLRLVRSFMAARWKASFVVRVAAASLMLHLAALPLLAYFGLTQRAPEFTLTFSPRLVPEYGESQEPEHEVEAESSNEFPELRDVPDQDELDIQNALQWARHHLMQGDLPGGLGNSEEPDVSRPVSRALAQRGSYLRAGRSGPAQVRGALGTDPGWALAQRDPIVRVIAVEHLLDRFVVERDRPAGLAAALGALGDAEQARIRALELRTLLRAQSYGLLDRAHARRLESFLGGLPGPSLAWDPLAPGAPLDRAHAEALGLALDPALADDPTVASWLRWRE